MAYRLVIRIWSEKAAAPIHIMMTGYGIGSLLAPVIAAPFLDPKFSGKLTTRRFNSTFRMNDSVTEDDTEPLSSMLYPARFTFAYWIVSGLGLTVSAAFILFYIYNRKTGISPHTSDEQNDCSSNKSWTDFLSIKACSSRHPVYGGVIVIVLFFYYANSIPLLRAFSKFLYSYARDGPGLTIHHASLLNSLFFISAMTSGLVVGVVSHYIHMKYILQVN